MTYFLDFDRTLFDTDSFTPTLLNNPACAHLREDIQKFVVTPRDATIPGGAGRVETWEKLDVLCREGKLSFAPNALTQFIFPDVRGFLELHGKDSVILSYGHPAWVRAKVESALAGFPLERIIYAEQQEKGIALKPLLPLFSAPYSFVDDLAAQLDSVKTHCAQVSLYEMRRDGKEGSGRYPVIRSFADIS